MPPTPPPPPRRTVRTAAAKAAKNIGKSLGNLAKSAAATLSPTAKSTWSTKSTKSTSAKSLQSGDNNRKALTEEVMVLLVEFLVNSKMGSKSKTFTLSDGTKEQVKNLEAYDPVVPSLNPLVTQHGLRSDASIAYKDRFSLPKEMHNMELVRELLGKDVFDAVCKQLKIELTGIMDYESEAAFAIFHKKALSCLRDIQQNYDVDVVDTRFLLYKMMKDKLAGKAEDAVDAEDDAVAAAAETEGRVDTHGDILSDHIRQISGLEQTVAELKVKRVKTAEKATLMKKKGEDFNTIKVSVGMVIVFVAGAIFACLVSLFTSSKE